MVTITRINNKRIKDLFLYYFIRPKIIKQHGSLVTVLFFFHFPYIWEGLCLQTLQEFFISTQNDQVYKAATATNFFPQSLIQRMSPSSETFPHSSDHGNSMSSTGTLSNIERSCYCDHGNSMSLTGTLSNIERVAHVLVINHGFNNHSKL